LLFNFFKTDLTDDFLSCFSLNLLSRMAGNISAFASNFFISTSEERVGEYSRTQRPSEVESKYSLFCAKSFGSRFWEISVVAVSASIFKTNSRLVMLSRKFSFLRPFKFLYCTSREPGPGLCNLIGQNSKFKPLFHSAIFPFICQCFSNFNTLKALIYPIFAVSFLQICLERPINS